MDLKGVVGAHHAPYGPLARTIVGTAVRARRWHHRRCLCAAVAGLACAVAHDVDLVLHLTRLTDL
jgi:hypothetical protein